MKTVNIQELIIENKKISLDETGRKEMKSKELGNKLINLYIDINNLTPDQTQKKANNKSIQQLRKQLNFIRR